LPVSFQKKKRDPLRQTHNEFFEMLQEIYETYGFNQKRQGNRIFNCDETSFSADQKRRKVFCFKKPNSVSHLTLNNDKQTYTV